LTYTLTVRRGSSVERERFEALDEAVARLRARTEEIRATARLGTISAFRDYEPGQRVAARLELSTGRMFRSRDAGLDVMGDGSLVPYAGGIGKRPLDAGGDSAFEAIRRALK